MAEPDQIEESPSATTDSKADDAEGVAAASADDFAFADEDEDACEDEELDDAIDQDEAFADEFVTLRIIDTDIPSPTSAKREAGIKSASTKVAGLQVARRPLPSPKGILAVGVVLCLVAIVVICGVFAYNFFAPASHDEIKRPYVSDATTMVSASNAYRPDFSKYAYIKTDGLDAANVYDVSVGDVYYEGENDAYAYCNVSAKASYRNDYIGATCEFVMRLAYDAKADAWVDDGLVSCSQTVEPVAGPDMDALCSDVLPALGARESDAGLAARMSGASVEAAGTLGKSGGIVEFVLTKEVARDASSSSAVSTSTSSSASAFKSTKTSSRSTVLELTVDESLAWSESEGWVATITQVGEVAETTPSVASVSSASSSSSLSSSDATEGDSDSASDLVPTKQLVCSAGDAVQIEGSIMKSDKGWMFKANDVIKVVIDGQDIVVQYFALSGKTTSLTDGSAETVIGKISLTSDDSMPLDIAIS